MKTFGALFITIFVLLGMTHSSLATVDCSNPTSSTQTGPLCQLAGTGSAADLPLNLTQIIGAGFDSVTALIMMLAGPTANNVCDTDCRCFMGATVAGGACGIRNSDGQTFCMCDYNGPAKAPLNPTLASLCPAPAFGLICDLAPTVCNSDCVCSHGNADNGQNTCTTNNGVPGNVAKYCVCNNHQNYQ